ncbi:Carbamoyl-phosphate synthase small chain [Streptomyces tanashiensis]
MTGPARRQHRRQRRRTPSPAASGSPDTSSATRRVSSNWRSQRSLDEELERQGVVGISGIDTRALTRHLRERGAMRVGIFSGDALADEAALLAKVQAQPQMKGANLSAEVATKETYVVPRSARRSSPSPPSTSASRA